MAFEDYPFVHKSSATNNSFYRMGRWCHWFMASKFLDCSPLGREARNDKMYLAMMNIKFYGYKPQIIANSTNLMVDTSKNSIEEAMFRAQPVCNVHTTTKLTKFVCKLMFSHFLQKQTTPVKIPKGPTKQQTPSIVHL